MLVERQSQPTLTAEDRGFKRAAEREFGADTNTVMRVDVMKLMATAEVAALLVGSVSAVEAQFDEDDDTPIVPTSTSIMPNQGVDRSGTPTPTTTPVDEDGEEAPEGVAVAMLSSNEMLSRSMAEFPSSVRFTTIHGTEVNYRFNWNATTSLNGTNGVPLVPGLYENRPRPISPDVMNHPNVTMNGVVAELDYMVGQVVIVDSGNGSPFVYLAVPLIYRDEMGQPLADQPANREFGIFEVPGPTSSNNFCRVAGPNGELLPLPGGVLGSVDNGIYWGNNARFPVAGADATNSMIVAEDGRSYTVPTVNGPVTVTARTMMGIEYAGNAVEIASDYGTDNNGRTPDQMIEAYLDGTLNLGAWGSDRAMLLVNDRVIASP